MKKRIKIFLGLLAATVVSCEDTLTETTNSQDSTAVSFSASITTRALGSVFEIGDEISVTAYDSEGAICEQNINYSYDGSLFSSDTPIKLSGEEDNLSYRAVYPYVAMSTDGNLGFTVQSDQSEASNYTNSDLMSSYLSSTSSSTPQLTFDHLLANIVVNVTSTDEEMVNVVASLNAAVGVYYNMLTLTSSSVGSLKTITMASNGVNSYKAIVPPQSIAANELFGEINIDGESYKFYSSLDIDIIGGNQYVINMSIEDGVVTFDKPVINSWGDGELPTVEQTSGVIYADGTWVIDSYYSCETSEGSVDALLDGDLSTYFHSAWSTGDTAGSEATPHWVVIDLGANYAIDAVLLAPRGASYIHGGYIETSLDNATWIQVGTYEFDAIHDFQTFVCAPTIARYVKISNTTGYFMMSGFAISGSYYGETTLSSSLTPAPSLTLSESSVALESTGGNFTINVAAEDTEDEVTYEVTEGEATFVSEVSGAYTFSVAANKTYEATTVVITFTCGVLTESVTITIGGAEVPVVDVDGTTADNTTFSIHSYTTQEEAAEASGRAYHLIDGDASTYWHSVWNYSDATGSYNAAGDTHYAVVDLNAYYTISGVLLTSRNSNEQVGTIYMSNDASSWIEQASYNNGSSASEQVVAISDETPYRYIKLEITSSNAMMAELNIAYTAVDTEADTDVEPIPGSITELDRSLWSVECTNTEPYEGSVAAMTDGDLSTYWHSTWSTATSHPHLIAVTFAETTSASGIYMYARQTNYNCQMYEFTLEVTTDGGSTWTSIGTYYTETTYDQQYFAFPSTLSINGFRITTVNTQPGNADQTVVAVAELGAYVVTES